MSRSVEGRISAVPPSIDIAALAAITVGLALLMEMIVLAAKFIAVGYLPTFVLFVADFLQQISWSLVICSTLALASAIAEQRSTHNLFLSLALTPVALIGTKVLQKGINTILQLPDETDVEQIAILFAGRVFEYTLLNVALFSLKQSDQLKFHKFLAAGFLASTGLGLPIGLRLTGGSIATGEKLGTVLNEVGWPILCTCFVYGAAKLQEMRKPEGAVGRDGG